MKHAKDSKETRAASTGEVLLSTELVEAAQRTDFWREANRPTFDVQPLSTEPGAGLTGSILARPLAGILLASTSFNAQHYRRDRRVIAHSGLDHYMVMLCARGRMAGDFDGITVGVRPGDIYVLDMARTVRNEAESGRRIIAVVPRVLLDKASGYQKLHGRVLSGDLPMTRLIASYLVELDGFAERPAEAETFAMQEALVHLLGAALRGDPAGRQAHDPAANGSLRRRVLEFIARNIGAPELGPELILRQFNVSRAHLYRTFAADGGVAKAVRDLRLDAAFTALTRADTANRSIAEIAYELGFPNGNQLLRSFRSRYGMTPGEARRSHQSAGQVPDLQAYFAQLLRRTVGGQPKRS